LSAGTPIKTLLIKTRLHRRSLTLLERFQFRERHHPLRSGLPENADLKRRSLTEFVRIQTCATIRQALPLTPHPREGG
jgi:hypothetical protein